ncbi:MAG: hypothetical protein K5622_05685 [Endomicrobiaceae bacterium]|nr:hypothetical protein [Endomicrobiaceae bacterium]
MFDIIKKQSVVLVVCFLLSFIICFFYPVKKELYSGIKKFFHNKTVVNLNNIVTVNYKTAQDNENKFVVSGSNPVLIIDLNNKYIENVTIKFKEQLQENLQPNIYITKEKIVVDNDNTKREDTELIKIETVEPLKERFFYRAEINDFFKGLVFVIGKDVGDSFVFENISYSENYKYYWNKVRNYNYREQLKTKAYWLNVLKLFGLFILISEYFVIRKYIYKRTGIIK